MIISDDPERFFLVGSELPPQEKEELIGFLRKNVDVFAWDAYDAPGIDIFFKKKKKKNPRGVMKKLFYPITPLGFFCNWKIY